MILGVKKKIIIICRVFSDLRTELLRLECYLKMQIDSLFTEQVKIPAHLSQGEISGLLF